jgi:hypothetical protein
MPILTLQQQAAELGRIRIGVRQATSNGKTRPAKLDTFRFTSPSQTLIERAASLYGGTVGPWSAQPDGPPQWETISTARELPILVPPQPVTQWFELWSAGGCQRRCDGVTETLIDSPCLCDPDPLKRLCKATTRLRVVLRDMPGVGVWRLESHGYYSAVELPALAEFLAETRGYVSAVLTVRERLVVRGGKTLRYMVPGIEIDATPAELIATGSGYAALSPHTDTAAVDDGGRAAIEPAPAPAAAVYLDTVEACTSMAMLTELYEAARADGFCTDMGDATDPVTAAFVAARDRLRGDTNGGKRAVRVASNADVHRAKEVVELPAAVPESVPTGDVDVLWYTILGNAPEDWTTAQVEKDFVSVTGVRPDAADVTHMRDYLAHRKGV